ncbi:MAG: DUF2889 domain-containing protein [Cycloclasticus sp.]|jgi:hypothetical protein|nr:DUF2889 domain-containing protein [Cycloclasticus sp.]MBQ0789631.1 DUF2889 domain-containing protein [Cycloclasticus sp.]|tara:strand:- start:3693 stop:4247 length:555 start_codon:yes stop_codon:yes gene_type:complete
MPLPDSNIKREHIHTRQVTCTGYRREDGLWDVDAQIKDTKTYTVENNHRGPIKPGVPIHEMWLRLTVDVDLLVHDCIAVTDHSPYACCPDITPIFKRLIGEKIAPGWTRRVKELVAGVQGCTHLADLVGPATTTIYQSMAGITKGKTDAEKSKPFYINGCHAWVSDGQQVLDFHPTYYTGKKTK